MGFQIRAHYWNPNGTNDLEIVNNKTGETVEFIEEGAFGISLNSDFKNIGIKQVLRHIAVSPCTDGRSTVRTLAKYFPSAARAIE